MLNEFEIKLVKALRSKKYTQGRNTLRIIRGPRMYAYCCLGVACNLYNRKAWKGKYFLEEENYLPNKVLEKLEWFSSHGELIFQGRHGSVNLAELNDTDFTFSQIADIIEAGLVRKIGE